MLVPDSPFGLKHCLLVRIFPKVSMIHGGIEQAAPFVRPLHANSNEDISIMYFTSGNRQTGNGSSRFHLSVGTHVTGSFWHNLNKDSLHLTDRRHWLGKAVWVAVWQWRFTSKCVCIRPWEVCSCKYVTTNDSDYRITFLARLQQYSVSDSWRIQTVQDTSLL